MHLDEKSTYYFLFKFYLRKKNSMFLAFIPREKKIWRIHIMKLKTMYKKLLSKVFTSDTSHYTWRDQVSHTNATELLGSTGANAILLEKYGSMDIKCCKPWILIESIGESVYSAIIWLEVCLKLNQNIMEMISQKFLLF